MKSIVLENIKTRLYQKILHRLQKTGEIELLEQGPVFFVASELEENGKEKEWLLQKMRQITFIILLEHIEKIPLGYFFHRKMNMLKIEKLEKDTYSFDSGLYYDYEDVFQDDVVRRKNKILPSLLTGITFTNDKDKRNLFYESSSMC